MKIILASFILLSGLLSAQSSLVEPFKRDSTEIFKLNFPPVVTPNEETPIDSTIAKLYKMPVAKPANPAIYYSLKAPSKINTQIKIPNLLNPLKIKKAELK